LAFAEITTYPDHNLKEEFERAAAEQLGLGMSSVHSGGYMGEHWLATFALTRANQASPSGH